MSAEAALKLACQPPWIQCLIGDVLRKNVGRVGCSLSLAFGWNG